MFNKKQSRKNIASFFLMNMDKRTNHEQRYQKYLVSSHITLQIIAIYVYKFSTLIPNICRKNIISLIIINVIMSSVSYEIANYLIE